ncbi:MAG: hypothetical protein AVDCRST_MAG08-3942 [uncultured Acetobacteraceae bacterium]|uniref:Uncharacterized protein n=1 Tax=uncultured Acetobacteraceae bacterium TaxID=169975 RepID=A0A6J4JM96_9PROT|nr:MAG: hypothetical protein AVDCRST_MAG08-3942 [uncultured Acetobacteraceae bacterium]
MRPALGGGAAGFGRHKNDHSRAAGVSPRRSRPRGKGAATAGRPRLERCLHV